MTRQILSLDFYGNEMIAALASLDEQTGTLRLRQTFCRPTRAFASAFVRDMQDAQNELTDLFSEIAPYVPYSPSVVIGLRGNFLSFKRSSGFQSVESRNRIIGPREMNAAIHNSVPTSLSESLEVVDILPQSYTIDGNIGITNPRGMSGFTLEVETFLSCALVTHLNTLNKVLACCGCNDYQVLPSIVALGESLVKPDEKANGTLLVDIGNTHTSALMYHKGALVDAWELGFGRETVVEAVADLLENDLPTVRELLGTYQPGSDEIMDEVLEDAQIRLLQKIKKELLQSLLYLKYPSTQVVLCGALADKALVKLAKRVFNARKVRLGMTDLITTDAQSMQPAYTGAAALIRHALEREQNQLGRARPKEPGLLDGLLQKLGFNQLF